MQDSTNDMLVDTHAIPTYLDEVLIVLVIIIVVMNVIERMKRGRG